MDSEFRIRNDIVVVLFHHLYTLQNLFSYIDNKESIASRVKRVVLWSGARVGNARKLVGLGVVEAVRLVHLRPMEDDRGLHLSKRKKLWEPLCSGVRVEDHPALDACRRLLQSRDDCLLRLSWDQ